MIEPAPHLLQKQATVEPHPFVSQTPLIGGLIVWFRTMWNNISTRWYVAPILTQQNEFNQLVIQQLELVEQQLIEQDRQLTLLTHELAELTIRHARQK